MQTIFKKEKDSPPLSETSIAKGPSKTSLKEKNSQPQPRNLLTSSRAQRCSNVQRLCNHTE